MGKFYVVWAGHHPGVYDNWDDCKLQITNFPNAIYKSYNSPQAAADAYRKGAAAKDSSELFNLITEAGHSRDRKSKRAGRGEHAHYMDNPEVDLRAWAVDAACAGNPGPVEYRGVELMSGRELFRIGPLQGGTNNLGEFLAIVHALALQKQMGVSLPIYSDSVSGMAWVRRRQIKTTLTPNASNTKLFELLHRAMQWLNTNSYSQPILKWDTPRWGEIPADFGRK